MSPEVNKQSHIVNGLILYKLAFFFPLIFLGCTSICQFCFLYLLSFYISIFLWEEKGGLQYMLALIA